MMVPQWLGINPANSFANLNDHAMPGHQNLDAKLDFVLKFTWLRQRFSFWKFWIKVYAQLKLMPLLDTYGMIVEHEALGIAWTWSDILCDVCRVSVRRVWFISRLSGSWKRHVSVVRDGCTDAVYAALDLQQRLGTVTLHSDISVMGILLPRFWSSAPAGFAWSPFLIRSSSI